METTKMPRASHTLTSALHLKILEDFHYAIAIETKKANADLLPG